MSEQSSPEADEPAQTEEELGQPKSNNEAGENNPEDVEPDSIDSSDPTGDPNPHGT